MIQAISWQNAERDGFCQDLLGDDYALWKCDSAGAGPLGGTLLFHPRMSHAVGSEAEIAQLVTEVAGQRLPIVRRLKSAGYAWAVPVTGAKESLVAVRLIEDNPNLLLELINRSSSCAWSREIAARQAQESLEAQSDQLTAYAAQVSEDLEELTWLRSLASNLELSESGNSVERIAESVLPSLCHLINASTVAYIRDVAVSGLDAQLPVIWQTGGVRISRSRLMTIVQSLTGRSPDRTVVRNYCRREFSDETFGGVESCIIVPVATASCRLGWLVAVNKVAGAQEAKTYGDPAYKTYMSEREFGSFEASLLSATAVVLAAHGRNCALFHEKELLLRGVIRSMINAIDAKDSYTCGHSDRVAEFARLIARELGLDFDECERIHMTGLLHDVGKIGVPDHVLKKPGQLTEQEFELIKQHPVVGYEILKHLENLSYVLPGVLHHHESVDGSGYPHGLQGESIPLAARILAVADAYDAMTSNRPYRRGMPTDRAEQILREGAGRQWDVRCVEAFFRTIHGIRLVASQRSAPLPVVNSALPVQ
ncbi:MAG: HD-GYP domain-containing protein [Planctomycetaceae bacterium]